MMNGEDQDSTTLVAVDAHTLLGRYLARSGWERQQSGSAGVPWIRRSSGEAATPAAIVVPAHVGPSGPEWDNIMQQLAVAEGRPQADITRDVLAAPDVSEQQAAAYTAAIETISQVQGVLVRLSDEANDRDQATAEQMTRDLAYWANVRGRLRPEDSAAVAAARRACAAFLGTAREPG